MKKDIHPQYYPEAEFTCACGNKFQVGSTASEVTIEICSKCHPFYTGKQKLVDTAGRLEKFKERASKKSGTVVSKKVKRATKKTKKEEN